MSGEENAGMDPLAKKALERLLKSADRHGAGVAIRQQKVLGRLQRHALVVNQQRKSL
ncbi:MAG TPA: hypothetical protein VN259_16915 [Xanthomonadales bacterium]|nr:hypothetical protein [Xanthomonadales bacterium]